MAGFAEVCRFSQDVIGFKFDLGALTIEIIP